MNITDFLLAQLAGDEADANLAIHPYGEGVTPPTGFIYHSGWPDEGKWMRDYDWSSDEAPHLARWSPARVLAECKAKRAIVAEHTNPHGYGFCPVCWDSAAEEPLPANCPTLRALAAIYKDRPGFRKEWE